MRLLLEATGTIGIEKLVKLYMAVGGCYSRAKPRVTTNAVGIFFAKKILQKAHRPLIFYVLLSLKSLHCGQLETLVIHNSVNFQNLQVSVPPPEVLSNDLFTFLKYF